jgi:hypothetical protein
VLDPIKEALSRSKVTPKNLKIALVHTELQLIVDHVQNHWPDTVTDDVVVCYEHAFLLVRCHLYQGLQGAIKN